MKDSRELIDLVSVGPATVRDFHNLGITEVEQLEGLDAVELFAKLRKVTGQKHDICCQDVFDAAIAQAEDANLPHDQCQWPYWSRRRKAARD